MSFDDGTRRTLAKTITTCRCRLIEDVTDQLGGIFGLHPDGTVLAVEKLTYLSPDQIAAARRLCDLLDHYTAGEAGKESDRKNAAYERMVLEISFTILNRLAALRLCEERKLVVPCVRQGTASDGFQVFERVSGGALGGRYETYRVFLECLFDEIALDLGVLFDRTTPQSAVFPSERCMEDILAELNKPDLTHLWTEDETIGWLYQYFNPKEERDAMRKASRSPRNTRELAVRNQFFTPRYVVEFLTDNSLGRIWYEMRKGDTTLNEKCRYQVRRPNEVFLAKGEKPPVYPKIETELTQEELLKQPVYIEHQPKKDPRDLRVLDPACGSGHFLLYAFDLLERIYEEAWDDPESPESEVTGRTIHEDFDTIDDLRRMAPKLIIEHNLHGIDIDPRAVQIAALALWLRAQKVWKNIGLRATLRPPIARSHIVTAEPMPGEEDMRREFTVGLKPRVLGQLVDAVIEKMKLAGEAGSVLKIEEELKDAVANARNQWRKGPKPEQQRLFPSVAEAKPKQQELCFDFEGETDERFWGQAEDRILEALKNYAEQAENCHAIRRQLFVEDAAQGFAFIDLCRHRYDVVLMNPPFGELTKVSENYIESSFPTSKGNILAHFLARAAQWTGTRGKIGAIVSRTCFFLTSLDEFRSSVLDNHIHVVLFADLGSGVLDAMVETAAAIFDRTRPLSGEAVFIRLLSDEQKEGPLLDSVNTVASAHTSTRVFLSSPKSFDKLKGRPYVYWVTPQIITRIAAHATFEPEGCEIRVGLQTGDDNRFLRLWHEVAQTNIIRCPMSADTKPLQQQCLQQTYAGKSWAWYSKIDAASPFVASIHLVVNWAKGGAEIKAYHEGRGYSASKYVMSESHYFRPGISYMLRSSRLVPYLVPKGVIPTAGRSQIYPREGREYWALFLAASNLASAVARFKGENFGQPKFQNSMVASVPYIEPPPDLCDALVQPLQQIMERRRQAFQCDETCIEFATIPIDLTFPEDSRLDRSSLIGEDLDVRVGAAFGFDDSDMNILQRDLMDSVNSPVWVADAEEAYDIEKEVQVQVTGSNRGHRVISYVLGCVFGRWDVRIPQDISLAPKPPESFAPLPVCSPGMLIGPDGLPADRGRIVSEEWLRSRPHGNTLPTEGAVKNPTVPDNGYPLRVSWEGILVDDPGYNGAQPHREDIVRRVREVLDLLWKDKAHQIEEEVCDILGVSDLREYFRKPAGFFQDHLKRYSKSRRKAPIYLPLSTASNSYTIWLYYHRLTEQTLYVAVNKCIEPKIQEVQGTVGSMKEAMEARERGEMQSMPAAYRKLPVAQLRKMWEESRAFLSELQEFRDEVMRIAQLPYKPNLNDGVIINAAPIHKLFRLRAWAKDTEDCWKKLEKGDYHWAYMAYTIWPDKVRNNCRRDSSIAIAHGLEELCEVESQGNKTNGGRSRRKKVAAQ